MGTKLDNLFTPGGRFVMGSLTEKEDKDFDGKLVPEDKQAYFFGVAVPKTDPSVGALIGQLYQLAVADYQSAPLVMAQIQQGLAARDFAWKIQDGDAPQYDSKTGAVRETPNYIKGCFIFKFRTQFEITACDFNGVDIARSNIKRGDYIAVMFNAATNGKVDATAGLYLNPAAIQLLGYGEAIQGGVKASAAFAGRQIAAPVGATQMPTTGGAAVMPGNSAPAQTQTAPAGMPGAGLPAAAPVSGTTASPSNPGYTPAPMAGMPGM
jgi:hypothetical protein